jgi:regulator of sigma D
MNKNELVFPRKSRIHMEERTLEQKLKDLLISTYEKVGDKIQSPGRQLLTPQQIVEELKNDTDVGMQYYKGIIGLTVEMLMRDKIHLDERRNEKINELLSKR